ncbi:hypothetical protein OHB36_26905 [Streptomyces sp. NBC_00320]|uniref:GNAT family N-acetyltransferase n=1 Tax=unclassified Streptomyces TaxID=2593676 RepID=UPI0022515372|nr:hypothetical protein [Streptomyces sp. NBC_00320]MCX5150352.1 hypothetical protein [Streptomyces sp. NBC_00320]
MPARDDKRPVRIRPGILEDLPALVNFYNHYVKETPVAFDVEPFTPDQRLE